MGDAIPLLQFFKMPRPVGGVIHYVSATNSCEAHEFLKKTHGDNTDDHRLSSSPVGGQWRRNGKFADLSVQLGRHVDLQ
jgi:hypothetical protein